MKTVQTVTPVRRAIVPVLLVIFYGNPMILTDLRQLCVTVERRVDFVNKQPHSCPTGRWLARRAHKLPKKQVLART
jgi:hypothetical protein